MGDAKRLIVKPIYAKDANKIVQSLHYSGKTVQNSQLHLGVFLDGKCGGAMQFGPSLDKRKMVGLVEGTLWNEFIELNRMAFADWLPRNGESRAIGYAFRWMRKEYPHIKWCVSFADGCQCGDGTIYRASGFVLTGLKVNNQIWEAPEGETFSRTSLTDGRSKQQQQQAKQVISRTTTTKGKHITEDGASSMKRYIEAGWKPKPGFQLRYIYFLDPTARERLTVPILPFSEIDRRGAGMYKGEPRVRSVDSDTSTVQVEESGANPTRTLLVNEKPDEHAGHENDGESDRATVADQAGVSRGDNSKADSGRR
jgi:hypothetical protein